MLIGEEESEFYFLLVLLQISPRVFITPTPVPFDNFIALTESGTIRVFTSPKELENLKTIYLLSKIKR